MKEEVLGEWRRWRRSTLAEPTWYPGDGDLPAAVAVAALAKGLDLDYVVLVGGQRQLHRGGVGLHDAGVAVAILLVQHLEQAQEQKEQLGVRRCRVSTPPPEFCHDPNQTTDKV